MRLPVVLRYIGGAAGIAVAIALTGLIVFSWLTLFSFGAEVSRPDPLLTPGAVRSTDPAEICSKGYARSHRTWTREEKYVITLRRYGIPASKGERYEDDDLIPVCLGGNNADPRNHWPQPWPEAHPKDRLEAEKCREVCDAYWHGTDAAEALHDAQEWFRTGGWAR